MKAKQIVGLLLFISLNASFTALVFDAVVSTQTTEQVLCQRHESGHWTVDSPKDCEGAER